MTLWMLATLLVSTLFAICAALGDRIAECDVGCSTSRPVASRCLARDIRGDADPTARSNRDAAARTTRMDGDEREPIFVAPETGPAAVGLLRPHIVVPRWLLDEDPGTRALVLRHEIEHVRARDTHALFGAAVLEVLFPWNGALRWMVRRLRLAIEIDCDQRVIDAVGGARQYGLALLAVGERYADSLPIAASLQESPLQIE
jgi:beta-lactamase regulating signal transducer with metallopeptidase domain